MFQLYKQRNFSNVFDDTIKFFKIYFKSYFSSYFKITGAFLLVLLVFFWFGYSFIYDGFFNTASGISNGSFIEQYFEKNAPLFITFLILGFLLFYILTVITTIFPFAFINLIEQNKPLTFDNVLQQYKAKLGKGILFSLYSTFTLFPIFLVIIGISVLLSFIIIGIPLLIIFYGAFTSIYIFSFIEYLNTSNGFFTSVKNATGYFFKKPWLCIGVTLVFYIIIQMISSCVTMIPYMIGIFDMIVGTQNGKAPNGETFSFFFIMMMITLVLSFFVYFFTQNIVYVNQGLLYYSNKEVTENVSAQSEIDLIGSSSNDE